MVVIISDAINVVIVCDYDTGVYYSNRINAVELFMNGLITLIKQQIFISEYLVLLMRNRGYRRKLSTLNVR